MPHFTTDLEKMEVDPSNLTYFAEGGANIIYTVIPDRAHLLRLRKDVPKTADYVPTTEIYSYLTETIAPHFEAAGLSDVIADHKLLEIPRTVLHELNQGLLQREKKGLRDYRRKGWGLKTDDEGIEYGILITNMAPRNSTEITLELKPKWLWSPPCLVAGTSSNTNGSSAFRYVSSKQRRCTTCALRASKPIPAAKKLENKPVFCPQALLNPNLVPGTIALLLNAVMKRIKATPTFPFSQEKTALYQRNRAAILERLTMEFTTGRASRVLRLLRDVQKELDPEGILSLFPAAVTGDAADGEAIASSVDGTNSHSSQDLEAKVQDYLQAMTLRDCTLFIRFSLNISSVNDHPIEIKVADVDKKVPAGIPVTDMRKVKGWVERERELIAQGYYHGIESLAKGAERDYKCVLWDS